MKTLLAKKHVIVLSDPTQNILELQWHGKVSLEDCKDARDTFLEHLTPNTNAVVNRSQLEEFEEDAKKWLKTTFMKNDVKIIINSLSRLATVESVAKIKLFSMAINKLLSILFPNLSMRSFRSREEAVNWIKVELEQQTRREEQEFELFQASMKEQPNQESNSIFKKLSKLITK